MAMVVSRCCVTKLPRVLPQTCLLNNRKLPSSSSCLSRVRVCKQYVFVRLFFSFFLRCKPCCLLLLCHFGQHCFSSVQFLFRLFCCIDLFGFSLFLSSVFEEPCSFFRFRLPLLLRSGSSFLFTHTQTWCFSSFIR